MCDWYWYCNRCYCCKPNVAYCRYQLFVVILLFRLHSSNEAAPRHNPPQHTIDSNLRAIPSDANRSERFPTSDIAGDIPKLANMATLNEDALMKYPSWDVFKCNLFTSINGMTVVNAEEDTPLSSLMNEWSNEEWFYVFLQLIAHCVEDDVGVGLLFHGRSKEPFCWLLLLEFFFFLLFWLRIVQLSFLTSFAYLSLAAAGRLWCRKTFSYNSKMHPHRNTAFALPCHSCSSFSSNPLPLPFVGIHSVICQTLSFEFVSFWPGRQSPCHSLLAESCFLPIKWTTATHACCNNDSRTRKMMRIKLQDEDSISL